MTHPLTDKMIQAISHNIHAYDDTRPFRADMRAAADWQLEQVVNAWEDAFQSDLEHGVRSLNDKAAKELAAKYPKIFAFGEVLAAMRPQQQHQQQENN